MEYTGYFPVGSVQFATRLAIFNKSECKFIQQAGVLFVFFCLVLAIYNAKLCDLQCEALGSEGLIEFESKTL